MRAATTSTIEMLEHQVEYLENVNRRLEEMADWIIAYPQCANAISEVYKDGIALGLLIREMESDARKTKRLKAVTQAHNDFILKYEALWQKIQLEC